MAGTVMVSGGSGYIAGELSDTHKGGTNYNVNGAINIPIAEGKLAARFVGWYINDSGFIDQVRIPAGRHSRSFYQSLRYNALRVT